ncbi:hypothetical protein HGM15179_019216, partial [Zosterops borbonicus]
MRMAGKVVLLLWGAQATQLLVEPPWRPAVLWDRVTLTCQGLGTASDTTWYKDGKRWGQKGLNNIPVNSSGTYQCYRPGTEYSNTVSVSDAEPQRPLPLPGPGNHNGRYRCRGQVYSWGSWVQYNTVPVTVTVH